MEDSIWRAIEKMITEITSFSWCGNEKGAKYMEILMLAINVLATVVIAFFAYCNHRLSRDIKNESDRYQEDMKNITEAIVISNIVANGMSGDIRARVEEFKAHYKDREKLFC